MPCLATAQACQRLQVHVKSPRAPGFRANSSSAAAIANIGSERCVDTSLAPGVTLAVPVTNDFISVSEEAAIFAQLEPLLATRRMEPDHWDAVIRGYRELQLPVQKCGPALAAVSQRVASAVRGFVTGPMIPSVHVIDLSEGGAIDYHVDSVKFSGNVVAGVSLLSDAVMQLRPDAGAHDVSPVVQLLLRRRSLYVLHDEARMAWQHALPSGDVRFLSGDGDVMVRRRRRISLIYRDELQ